MVTVIAVVNLMVFDFFWH